jgi:small subunit ribosomal protein S10
MTQKIRLIIKGYDNKLVDKSTHDVISLVVDTGAKVRGPVPLPTLKWKVAVQRSPHIDAKSKEHYGMSVHKRLLDVLDYNHKTIEAISHYQLPYGVSIDIKQ